MRISSVDHIARMIKRRHEQLMREPGFDKLLPSVNDATLMRHLNRKHKRRLASKRYRKAVAAAIKAAAHAV